MVTPLLETPAITRDAIVNQLNGLISARQGEIKTRIQREREDFDHSETDRDAKALLKAEQNGTIRRLEDEATNLEAFQRWLRENPGDVNEPLRPGNFWLLQSGEDRWLWLVYDPLGLRANVETYVGIDFPEVRKLCGVNEISTLSVNCRLYDMLIGKIIRENADISVSVDGNNPETCRLLQVF